MKVIRTIALLLCLCLLIGAAAGCKTENPAAPPSTEAPSTAAASVETTPPAEALPSTAPPTTQTAPETTDPPAPAEGDEIHPLLFLVTGPSGEQMFLFGTFHGGDDRVDVVLDQLAPVVYGCDALAVELDMTALSQDMETRVAIGELLLLPDGKTVDQYMSRELYEKMYTLVRKGGLAPTLWRRCNLAYWAMLAEEAALVLTCPELCVNSIDYQLTAFCYENGVEVREVESAEQQYGMLASFSDELSLLRIEKTLNTFDTCGEQAAARYVAWLSGDYDRILAQVLEDETPDPAWTPEQQALFADYNYRMRDERNLDMRDKALEWLAAGDKVFFAVGAAHLVGDAGLVTLLREAGYTVEQIQYVP